MQRTLLLLVALAAASPALAETVKLKDGKALAGVTLVCWRADRLIFVQHGQLRQVARHRIASVESDSAWGEGKLKDVIAAAESAKPVEAIASLTDALTHASGASRKAVAEALAKRLMAATRHADAWAHIAEFPDSEVAVELVIAAADRAKVLRSELATLSKPASVMAKFGELASLASIPGCKVTGESLAMRLDDAIKAANPGFEVPLCTTCGGDTERTCSKCNGNGYFNKKKAVFGGTGGTRYVNQRIKCKPRLACKKCTESGLDISSIPRAYQASLKKLVRTISGSMAKKEPSESVGDLPIKVYKAGFTFPSNVSLPYPADLMTIRQTLKRLPRSRNEVPSKFGSAWRGISGEDKAQTTRRKRMLLLRLALEWGQLYSRMSQILPMDKGQMPKDLAQPGAVPLTELALLIANASSLNGEWVRCVARIRNVGEAPSYAAGKLFDLGMPIHCQTISPEGLKQLKSMFDPLARSSSPRSKQVTKWVGQYPAAVLAERAGSVRGGDWVAIEGRLQLPAGVSKPTLEVWQITKMPPIKGQTGGGDDGGDDGGDVGGDDGGDNGGGNGGEMGGGNGGDNKRPLPPILTPGGTLPAQMQQADQYFERATSESGARRSHYLEAARRWYVSARSLAPNNAYINDRIRDCKRWLK